MMRKISASVYKKKIPPVATYSGEKQKQRPSRVKNKWRERYLRAPGQRTRAHS